MNKHSKVYVAGHQGMVGSAIVRKLKTEGYLNLITVESEKLDLRNQQSVSQFFESEKPEYVFLCAAKSGGILSIQKQSAEFIYDNLLIESNIIHHSYLNGIKKLLFLGSSSIYPKSAPQPLKEEYLLSGFLDESNKPLSIAKIAGIKLCESYREEYGCNYISIMPSNIFGPNDNFDLDDGNVIPVLFRKFITAREKDLPEVNVWGSGLVQREFMYVDDFADACFFLMNNYNEKELLNVGTGSEISIINLAYLIKEITGYNGKIIFDKSKPEGLMRKVLDINKLSQIGWKAKINLKQGLQMLYSQIKNNKWND